LKSTVLHKLFIQCCALSSFRKLTEQKQQLKPELPSTQDPQLPEIIAATTANTDQDELNNEPQTVTAAESEQITSPATNTESSMKKRKIGRSSSTNKTPAVKPKSSKIKKRGK
jgi:hypothetical protein